MNKKQTELSHLASKQIPSDFDIYENFKNLCDIAFKEIENSGFMMRSIVSEYLVPISPEMIAEAQTNETIDNQFYEEFAKEVKNASNAGKDEFFKFLLRNYQITIKDNQILNEFDSEIGKYSKQIVDYFFESKFTDPTEKQMIKLTKNTLSYKRWM